MADQSSLAMRTLGARAVLTGPPAGDALENINTNPLDDGARCWVTAEGKRFRFVRASSAVADGVNVVAPSAGPGRWFLDDACIPLRRVRYVDGGTDVPVETRDGSICRPFATIQQGVDAVVALTPTPSVTDPALVYVAPTQTGYDETVIILQSGVSLHGMAGQGVTRVRPTAGPSLVLSNATSASLATFLSGFPYADQAALDAAYALLVNNGTGPWDNQFRDMDFAPLDSVSYPVMCVGVQGDAGGGTRTSFGGNEFNFMRCTFRDPTSAARALWARNTNYISLQSGSWMAGEIRVLNVAGVWVNDAEMQDYGGRYLAADPAGQPNDTGNYGLSGGKTMLRGTVTLNDEARIGYDRLAGISIEGDLACNATSRARLRGGFIEGNVTAAAGADFIFQGVHVQGNLTLTNAAPLAACTMDGGRYMGVLTDVGVRLTRTLGS